ncbi:MAG: AMP phosphorylase [Candidatus Heimdallarchaeota archaeon]|nr:MAG: AMP phosphorylase [Candidatus Heimdallarchaeota archaeon]
MSRPIIKKPADIHEFKVEKAQIFPKNTVILSPKAGLFTGGFKNPQVQLVSSTRTVFTEHIVLSDHVPVEEIWVSDEMLDELDIEEGEILQVLPLSRTPPDSYWLIRKRMVQKRPFKPTEITAVVNDIAYHRLSQLEKTAFVLSQVFDPFSMDEIEELSRAMAETGEIIDFGQQTVFGKHSTGGVPGNKVSLLIVPIIAASGLLIPKTSSRAITSPSGTADTMEAFGCDVVFNSQELVEISQKTRGMIVWGGGFNLAPADDILIRDVEFPLGVNPTSMMLASIMSKKLATGIHFLVMDLPTGHGTKIADVGSAQALGRDFAELGRRLGITVESGITFGASPVGHAVGSALEAREALNTLMNPREGPSSLVEKSCELSGILLEMAGKALRGQGRELAKQILYKGDALEKFREILDAQSGDKALNPDDIPVGQYTVEILSPSSGWIVQIDNVKIAEIARTAGCPKDKGAGIVFLKKKDAVRRGESLVRIYSSSESRLSAAEGKFAKLNPITIEGMLIGRV